MPAKHQPDFSFLRHVPLRRVHLFTLVQIICLAVLWVLKSTFLAIVFPVMVSVFSPSSLIFPLAVVYAVCLSQSNNSLLKVKFNHVRGS